MFGLVLPSDALRHSFEISPRAFQLALCLFPLFAVHLGQGFAEPPSSSTQHRRRYLQIALQGSGC
jgi:hypothetical protein